jgi:hypothetical protein
VVFDPVLDIIAVRSIPDTKLRLRDLGLAHDWGGNGLGDDLCFLCVLATGEGPRGEYEHHADAHDDQRDRCVRIGELRHPPRVLAVPPRLLPLGAFALGKQCDQGPSRVEHQVRNDCGAQTACNNRSDRKHQANHTERGKQHDRLLPAGIGLPVRDGEE